MDKDEWAAFIADNGNGEIHRLVLEACRDIENQAYEKAAKVAETVSNNLREQGKVDVANLIVYEIQKLAKK